MSPFGRFETPRDVRSTVAIGAKQTQRGQLISVEIDPKATSSVVGLRAVLLYLLAQFGMGRVSATQARGAENRQRWSLGHDRPLK
jgi:hypothetical protein